MATHSSILAWETPWTEEPGGLQSMGFQKKKKKLMSMSKGYKTNLKELMDRTPERTPNRHLGKCEQENK